LGSTSRSCGAHSRRCSLARTLAPRRHWRT